jgi:hypothetical protein
MRALCGAARLAWGGPYDTMWAILVLTWTTNGMVRPAVALTSYRGPIFSQQSSPLVGEDSGGGGCHFTPIATFPY